MTILNPNVEDKLNGKNIFLIMVGPSGSGKSTKVKQFKSQLEARDAYFGYNRQTLVISSDAIRDELFGVDRVYDKDKNQEVFALLHRRIKDNCGSCNIVIDATNLTIKTRASLINCTKKNKNDIYYVAYVKITELETMLQQNAQRTGVARVPDDVIVKHMKAFQIPVYEEGFDKIYLDEFNEDKINSLPVGWNLKTDELFQRMIGFDQKNPHHLYTLDKHTMNVVYGIANYYYQKNQTAPKTLMRAAILHDIGKLYVGEPKTEPDGTIIPNHYRYKGHANYGAYLLLNNLDKLGFNTLDEIIKCIALVNYHMEPFQWRVEKADGTKVVLPKTIEKMKKRYGKYFDMITFFNKFDKLATGTETNKGPDAGDDEFIKVKKKKEKVKPQGLTKKQKKQLKKQRKKEEKRLRRAKKKAKELARQEWLAKRKALVDE